MLVPKNTKSIKSKPAHNEFIQMGRLFHAQIAICGAVLAVINAEPPGYKKA